jgi:hypothetical protein
MLAHSMMPLIEKWDEPEPRAIQVLEVLDHCINGSLSAGIVITALQREYEVALKRESVSHDDMALLAVWRNH